MNQLIFLIAAAFMVIAGIYLGQQGLALARVNNLLRGVVQSMDRLGVLEDALQRVLAWETTDFENDEKREYALCGLVDDIYKLLHPNEPTAPSDSDVGS